MTHFRLLADPQAYVAHRFDLAGDAQLRQHWLDHYARHFEQVLKLASVQYGRTAGRQIQTAGAKFAQCIQELRGNPAALPGGKLNIMELCRLRQSVLREQRLPDPYIHVKERENVAAMKIYPQVIRKLHSAQNSDRWQSLMLYLFAGNVFDVGSSATMHMADEGVDFWAEVEETKPRPWLIDDFDRLLQDLPHAPPSKWSKAIVMVDNAGSDFVLGIMPLARELGLMGTRIVLAANELPALNDMTANETVNVVERLCAIDTDLAALVEAGMFEVVSTGNDLPLIDLSSVSDELNEAAADADLLVIEGMGRALESNFDAQFTVDTLKVALLKDPTVAKKFSGEVYDCVLKYEPLPAPPAAPPDAPATA